MSVNQHLFEKFLKGTLVLGGKTEYFLPNTSFVQRLDLVDCKIGIKSRANQTFTLPSSPSMYCVMSSKRDLYLTIAFFSISFIFFCKIKLFHIPFQIF